MKKKNKYPIIPIFLHYSGCPGKCIYCNQYILNGTKSITDAQEVKNTLDNYKYTNKNYYLAFYGATFTNMPLNIQKKYLDITLYYPFLKGIIISTRPDCINENILCFLKNYNVIRIELGVQSLNEDVLSVIKRKYDYINSRKVVKKAISLIKSFGMEVSAHIMIGLPHQTKKSVLEDIKNLINWGITYLRVHPTLVLKDTYLEKMYKNGEYVPISLEEAVNICTEIIELCIEYDVKILRFGLQPTDTLLQKNNIVSGPFHPSFGELVYNAYYRKIIEKFILKHRTSSSIKIFYPPRLESKIIGLKKINKSYFLKKFPDKKIEFKKNNEIRNIIIKEECKS